MHAFDITTSCIIVLVGISLPNHLHKMLNFVMVVIFFFVCSFSRRSCKNSMNLDCYLRHSAEQYAKAPTYWVFANFKFGIDYVPMPLQLWALDPAPKLLLTFSGIYDVTMDFYHCLSSWHKANSFYSMFLFMQSMNMGISVFLSSLPFLLGCLVNGGRWFCLNAFISFPEKTYLHRRTLIVVYILWMT